MIRLLQKLSFQGVCRFSVFSAAALLLASCGGRSQFTNPNTSAAQAANAGNFSRTYFIGDSLTAGFQSGSLLDTAQVNGYANLLATQEKFPIVLPLIAPPGAPGVLQLISINPLVITPTPGTTTGRDNPTQQATDLAVPGHHLIDAISTKPSPVPTTPEDQITTLVLGIPGLGIGLSRSQLDWAENLDPTTVIVWIGNNDALVADETGMPSSMTPVAAFTTQYTQLIQGLQQNTRAHLVIATIPDVTAVPYLTPAATVIAQASAQSGIPATVVAKALGIGPGDLVNTTGIGEIPAILASLATATPKGPIDDAGFLSAAEVAQVQSTVNQYNQVITQRAQAAGATLVDVHQLFADVTAGKYTVSGVPITANFLGGAFSLDGIHPTNTGYAIVANYFIDSMNAAFKQTTPDVDLATVAAVDPLFPPNIRSVSGHVLAPGLAQHITAAAGKQVDTILKR
ncbi:MAG: SGNH/GDSL hydrolase family protein [Acidobacteriaceae bacterium]